MLGLKLNHVSKRGPWKQANTNSFPFKRLQRFVTHILNLWHGSTISYTMNYRKQLLTHTLILFVMPNSAVCHTNNTFVYWSKQPRSCFKSSCLFPWTKTCFVVETWIKINRYSLMYTFVIHDVSFMIHNIYDWSLSNLAIVKCWIASTL